MKTLERTMTSAEDELATRLADECASTLLAYYQAENYDSAWKTLRCDGAWKDHEEAVRRYEETFPRLCDWQWLVPRALLDEIRRSHP